MKFLKLKEENLPTQVVEDTIIFTEKGNIYVNKKDGTLIAAGGTGGGTSGGGGGGNTMETVDIVTELPEAAYNGDIKLYVKDGMPLWTTFYGGNWYSYGMIKHKVKGFVTAEMIKDANPAPDGLVVSVVPDETISDFSSYVQVSHQIANGTRWIYFDFTCDEGIIRIPWQVGTEDKYDFGYLTIDGTTILAKSGVGRGNHYMNITAGTHRVGLGFQGDVSNWNNGNFFRIWGIEYFVLTTPAEVLSNIPGDTSAGGKLEVVDTLPETPSNDDSYILSIPNRAPKLVSYIQDKWWQTTMVPYVDDANIMLTLTGAGCAKLVNQDCLKPTGAMSFSARVRPSYDTAYSYVVGSGAETTDRRRGICLVITSSSTIFVGAKNNDKKTSTGYFSFTRADVLDIVAVFDLNNLYVYINGVLVKTQAATTNTDTESTSVNYTAHIAGPSSGSSNTFSGHMEHFATYDRALTQEDVTALLTQTPDTIQGVSHYWPLNDGGDKLTDVIGGEVANLTGTYAWPDKPLDVPREGLTCLLSGKTPANATSLSTWSDLSGRANNATLVNMATSTAWKGSSLLLDGTNDYVSLTGTPTTAYTLGISFTVRNAGFTAYAAEVICDFEGGGRGIELVDKTIFNFQINIEGVGYLKVQGNYAQDVRLTCIMSYDGTSTRCYVDGVLLGTIPGKLKASGYPLTIGANPNPSSYDAFCNMEVFNYAYYDRALNEEAISQLNAYLSN